MTSRRNKLLLKMLGTTTGETEERLLKLSIERIVADQAEYYKKFYKNEGPGAIVFSRFIYNVYDVIIRCRVK